MASCDESASFLFAAALKAGDDCDAVPLSLLFFREKRLNSVSLFSQDRFSNPLVLFDTHKVVAVGSRSGSTEAESEDLHPSSGSPHLQHISDQVFLGDSALDSNPSDHPRASTIFLDKSQTDVPDKRRKSHINQVSPGQLAEIYTSRSTIFADSCTVSQPNLRSTTKCDITNSLP